MSTIDVTRSLGRIVTAMVTPFQADGIDRAVAGRLAGHLTQAGWNDGVLVNGTTGESATTSDREKAALIESVRAAVGEAAVVAGVGTSDTAHSVRLARDAAAAGASGLLVVTPYYVRPTQAGIVTHLMTVADATDLPVLLYDIPKRTGSELSVDTLQTVAEHPRIVAVKDATGDLAKAQQVMEATGLAYYSGDDALNLAFAAVGAVGVVSVVGHMVGGHLRATLDAVEAGDLVAARAAQAVVNRATDVVFREPGAASAKAAMGWFGLDVGDPRGPLAPATPGQVAALHDLLESL